jgi:hypothetical protein
VLKRSEKPFYQLSSSNKLNFVVYDEDPKDGKGAASGEPNFKQKSQSENHLYYRVIDSRGQIRMVESKEHETKLSP